MSTKAVLLEELMVRGQPSVDPRNSPSEEFELYSIPAYDKRVPEHVFGSEVGSAKKVVQPGDLLLSRIVPHIRRAWVVPSSNGKRQIASGEWIVFRNHAFEPRFLRHFIMGDPFHSQFMNTVAGVGGSLVRARPENVGRIEVSLPPLSEQKRIADILDKADAIRDRCQKAIAETRNLTTSAIEYELERLGSQGLSISSLGSVCIKITDGTHLTPAFKTEGIPFIFVKNIVNHRIRFETSKFIDDATYRQLTKSTKIEVGDVLYTTVGATYGQAALVRSEKPFAFQRHLAHLKPNRKEVIPEYLAAVMNLPRTKRQADRWARGAAQPTLNLTELRDMFIPQPTLSEQKKIVDAKLKCDTLIDKLERAIADDNQLFNTLVQSAFKGEL